jgi:hypothetical protein
MKVLGISIDGDKFNALNPGINHVIYGVFA